MSKSHHFRGICQYADQLMDLAEGKPVFTGRGQKPSNKEILAEIASIKKCQQGSFFKPRDVKPCSCGWHNKAAARKKAKLAETKNTTSTTSVSLSTTCTTTVFSSSSPSLSASPSKSTLSSTSTLVPPTPSVCSPTDTPKAGPGPVPPKVDFQSLTIGELRAIGIGTKTSKGKLDLLVYCPLTGRCPHCKSALISANSVGKTKLCYSNPWPVSIVRADVRCGKCNKHFMSHDSKYVDTLPSDLQMKRDFVTGKGNGSHISLLRLLRSGLTVAQVERYVENEVRDCYLRMKEEYIQLWDKVHAMHGVGKVNIAPRDGFPPFPSHYCPKRSHLTAMFVRDYWENKPSIMRELRTVVSSYSLAVDHQRKVVKRTLGGDVVGRGGQTFTICGDFGIICGVYVVLSLGPNRPWMRSLNDTEPQELRSHTFSTWIVDAVMARTRHLPSLPRVMLALVLVPLGVLLSRKKLDAMHMMLRIGREMNAEHPRRKKFLVDLSIAMLSQHEGDLAKLMEARKAAGFDGPPTRTERVKYIRRVVGDPESVAKRMLLVLKANRELDTQCYSQAQAAGLEVDNVTVASVAYPLITTKVISVFQQQLVHVRNGCISEILALYLTLELAL